MLHRVHLENMSNIECLGLLNINDYISFSDLVYISDNTYNVDECVQMTITILETLEWKFYPIQCAESYLKDQLSCQQWSDVYINQRLPTDFVCLEEDQNFKQHGYTLLQSYMIFN